eukprot:gene10233-biopygen3282
MLDFLKKWAKKKGHAAAAAPAKVRRSREGRSCRRRRRHRLRRLRLLRVRRRGDAERGGGSRGRTQGLEPTRDPAGAASCHLLVKG